MSGAKVKSALLAKYLDKYQRDPASRVFAPLAESYRKLGMIAEAMEILKKGISIHPSYVLGYVVLAQCYFDLRDYERSYQVMLPFIESNRDNLILQNTFARCCVELGYLEQALETYKYLLLFNPKDTFVASEVKKLEQDLVPIARRTLSDIGQSENNANTNQEDENSVVDSIDNWAPLDLSQKKRLNTDSFEFNENKDVKIDKTNNNSDPLITLTLVDLYVKQGHIEQAVDILEKILILNPNDERTREKLNELKNDNIIDDNHQHDNLLNMVESKVSNNQNIKFENYISCLEILNDEIKQASQKYSL
jgi:tetratricopeptide (TPR) repeat protein